MDLMLDSGAFSAWRQKRPVDLAEYAEFLRKNIEHIDTFVNLDVIPGEFGRVPSSAEVEISAQQGWDNMLFLESEGFFPIPVFHMGESFSWLRKMMEHGSAYIGISPANDRTTREKILWLDRVFEEITDAEGKPLVKTHAFGVTSVPILYRYPWYSADSASWVFTSATGSIMVPKMVKGSFDYTDRPKIVTVSVRDKQRSASNNAFSQMKSGDQGAVLKFLEFCGVTIEQVRDDYRKRAYVNVRFFLEVERHRPVIPFKKKHQTFFKDT